MNRLFWRFLAVLMLSVMCSFGGTALVVMTFTAPIEDVMPLFIAGETPPADARPVTTVRGGADARLTNTTGEALVFARASPSDQWVRIGPLGGGPPTVMPLTLAGLSALVTVCIALLISAPISRQLRNLHDATTRLEAGDMSSRAVVSSSNELGRLAEAFNKMASRRQGDLREREALLQAVAHELGTPLSRMHFSLAFLRDALSTADREHHVTSLEDELVALDALVTELVTWVESAAPADETVTSPREDAIEVIRRAIDKTAQHSSKEFALHAPAGMGLLVARPFDLRRVVDNLLRNAERYARMHVVAEVRMQPGFAIVEIRDDGPGVAPEQRLRVFEPFARLDDARGREHGGVGLGLAIVWRLVTRAGGTIEIRDAPEGGACFSLTWPVVEPEADDL